MPLYWKKKAVLLKPETVYGTDSGPTGVANALLVSDLEITPMEGQSISRNLERPHLGAEPELQTGTYVTARFKIEIAGSGTAGTEPAYGPVLRACRLEQRITEDVRVDYLPHSADPESCTIYVNVDGTLHKLLGARGSVSGELGPLGIPRFAFAMTGLFVPVAAGALPSIVTTGFKDPLPLSKTNTPTITLHGFACAMTKFTFDLKNTVKYRAVSSQEYIAVPDRAPDGSITIEAPPIGTKDFFAIVAAGTLGALHIVHGIDDGHIVELSAPAVQIGRASYGNEDNVVTLTLPLKFIPVAGNDELVLTLR
jgi:hypothetical protein